jgi:hypothetical protein
VRDITEYYKKRIECEERLRFFLNFQKGLEQEDVIPRIPELLLRKHGRKLEHISAALIGLFVGEISIFLVFLIINKLLHLNL